MPELYKEEHKHENEHDDKVCRMCGTLLNRGRCIYKCVNGGNRCIYCCFEGIVNNVCLRCHQEQTGQLTKAAKK